jgi:preprotein translocase SecF subunit
MWLLEKNMIKNLPMLHIIRHTNFNFIKFAPIFVTLSLVVNIFGLANLLHKGNQAYGIDFVGGQVQQYRFKKPVVAEDIRAVFKQADVKDAVIQQFDKAPENVIIRTPEESFDKVSATFKEKFKDNPFEVMRLEKVGPVVGQHLRQQAMWALLAALGGILIYVGIRFKHFDFATAAVVALFHDVLIALGLTVFLGRQVDLLVITALLTIAGYSMNDTIVIYDRVRENMSKIGNKKMTLPEIINLSINQTLGRTILTTLATMLVVVALLWLGGEVLNTFSLTIFIGFLAGMYSTIYVVSPIVVWWHKFTKTTW